MELENSLKSLYTLMILNLPKLPKNTKNQPLIVRKRFLRSLILKILIMRSPVNIRLPKMSRLLLTMVMPTTDTGLLNTDLHCLIIRQICLLCMLIYRLLKAIHRSYFCSTTKSALSSMILLGRRF